MTSDGTGSTDQGGSTRHGRGTGPAGRTVAAGDTGQKRSGRRPEGPKGRRAAGPGRLGGRRAGPAVEAAEHLLPVTGPRQAGADPGPDPPSFLQVSGLSAAPSV